MSETPQQPGTPDPHEMPQNPGGAPQPGAPEHPAAPQNPAASAPHAAPAPQAWPPASAGAAPPQAVPGAQPAAAGASRRSTWNDAVSTPGGKAAVVVAAASLALVVLLLTGLAAVGLGRHFGGDRDRGVWTSSNDRGMPGPGQMDPGHGQRGPGTPEQVPPGQDRRGTGDLPGMGMGLGMGAGGALHGEAVIPGEGGTATRAVLFQRGQVTAVTTDKLTVRSTDGFSATYTIGADTRDRLARKVSTLATGDEVTVVATKADATTIRILRSGRTGDS
ncbi:hypothetical protein GCM10022415_12110 [Knoellia locipacati]|uniref:DUF5666 domain-containing protein n=1 Tax=Knoellia locipacati TaxID=882824 RepID=A0A512SYY7_9MICO|nr:hypothetical protein [Knoellia locipacati]GEQ13161.1 hypothetical protein KLO01_12080 [Knoellia locipacati]